MTDPTRLTDNNLTCKQQWAQQLPRSCRQRCNPIAFFTFSAASVYLARFHAVVRSQRFDSGQYFLGIDGEILHHGPTMASSSQWPARRNRGPCLYGPTILVEHEPWYNPFAIAKNAPPMRMTSIGLFHVHSFSCHALDWLFIGHESNLVAKKTTSRRQAPRRQPSTWMVRLPAQSVGLGDQQRKPQPH
jgi:hypothetical protein